MARTTSAHFIGGIPIGETASKVPSIPINGPSGSKA